ncbi:hypothetical protein C1645_813656 [Glomus cerebriforme]|uniref:Uncharacterized protein n=1 Tax=Glomus cerebriforme TaxID=658196 RepID=A0A397TRT7_9GLOM|nr:hypothetical protein C1645_813656 [Glomus cerebriforme]
MDNINKIDYSESIKYNADNTVNVPFSYAADWYINNVSMLKVCHLKHQNGNNCQRICDVIGECLSDCQNRNYKGNLKNAHDIHLCAHLSHNFTDVQLSQIIHINLDLSTRDMILKSRHTDHFTAKGIKMKILAPLNGASEKKIKETLNDQQKISNSNEPENSLAKYYQLTVSDEFWLCNGRDFGKVYIGLDDKYDLNIDHIPVLSVVIENNTGCGMPLAFALSNKENHMTIVLLKKSDLI